MPGLFLDQGLDGRAFGVVLRLIGKMQHDTGATAWCRRTIYGRHRKVALAIRRPLPRLRRTGAARNDVDALGDHESRIEPHAEPADQRLPLGALSSSLTGIDAVQKGLGTGARNRAERVDQ